MQRYELPIHILDPNAIDEADEEFLYAMADYAPNTKLKPGDLAYLTEATPFLRMRGELLPRFWQIRFVISSWTYELFRLAHSPERLESEGLMLDRAIAMLDEQKFSPTRYEKPVIYAHAFPHGLYPDSATWFPEWVLKRVSLRENNQHWERILEEARAPYAGYANRNLIAPYTLDLAPDLYKDGSNVGRPFSFEDATTHTLALLGGEEPMFRPVSADELNNSRVLDPRHDMFRRCD